MEIMKNKPSSESVPPKSLLGYWKITEMDLWDAAYIDLVVPGHITFERDGLGEFQFGTVHGWIDCRFGSTPEGPEVQFSWEGESDTDPGCGRGWARLRDGKLVGRIFIHLADVSGFVAQKPSKVGA